MKKIWFIVLLLGLYNSLNAQTYEKDYQQLIQQQMGGQVEVAVPSGRIDLLTEEYAIEIEFANKWKQSIGQALWYGLQTTKTPGIILIKRDGSADNKYVVQLGSTLSYAGLNNIRVWVWPDDFSVVERKLPQTRQLTTPPGGTHWITTSSHKRHNANCRYFNSSKGRWCTATEGIACGVCGG